LNTKSSINPQYNLIGKDRVCIDIYGPFGDTEPISAQAAHHIRRIPALMKATAKREIIVKPVRFI
jgi:hypothetical protein